MVLTVSEHPPDNPTCYRVDANDQITWIGAAWDDFAFAGSAPELSGRRVIDRPLFDFIADDATRELYGRILQRVREGRRVIVPFRCDAPHLRRFMQLQLDPLPDGGIQFTAVLLRAESREPVGLLDPQQPRSSDMVRVCAWCRQVAVGDRWLEVEAALAALGTFNAPQPPVITHGACASCVALIESAIELAAPA